MVGLDRFEQRQVGERQMNRILLREREKKGKIVLKVGCLNVRGMCSEIKKKEIEMMCEERTLDLIALGETKVKGKGELDLGSYKGFYSGVNERVRGREGVAIMMKEDLWQCVAEVSYTSSRIMWVKLKLGYETWDL